MKFTGISKRKLSKLDKKMKKMFPSIMKCYNSDLSQKYVGINLINYKSKAYPNKIIPYERLTTNNGYRKIVSDLPKVDITKRPRVLKFYKKFKYFINNGNIRKANEIIQNLYTSEYYFTYEFSMHIRNEFLSAIKNRYEDFDKNYAIKLFNQLTYKFELELLNELSNLYYENIKGINYYLKQIVMEIKLSGKMEDKLCVEYKDFSM